MDFIFKMKEKALKNIKLTKEEGVNLFNSDLKILLKEANNIRKELHGDSVELCSIINGKCGKCGEDCAYCAQSRHHKTNISEYNLLGYEKIKRIAKENEDDGVHRFSIVTSGKGLYGDDFKRVVDYYWNLNRELKISLCASHGIIDKESLVELKKAGVKRYHHNLETSKNYYGKICKTHSYEERIRTIKHAKEAGLEVCSGGIIGLGESVLDRIELAITLRELEIKSIPINVLSAIKGTKLQDMSPLKEDEILRTIAVFRFINPQATIRLGAGRHLLKSFGENAFKAGANATITGNLLTTCGNKTKDDKKLIKKVGMRIF
ncbi:biotin synthase BioB [Clostridium perfringens]|uniref:biotin synthase BioB n=1 Tax=Clostridium perfringens TaxID=1502 RepID=UPI001A2EDA9D|nr:biotin synthase BioB [Clostridium perfringens]MBO3326947.1 biotin synthase BioB [Clostridium perfringens]HAT4356307.1 biotin synthase BioB [Clostridium perfringens]HJF37146.1 biotin synthase BioB [Clostridium perfringens]